MEEQVQLVLQFGFGWFIIPIFLFAASDISFVGFNNSISKLFQFLTMVFLKHLGEDFFS